MPDLEDPAFGGLVALDDLTMEIRPGAIHSLVGPDGAGKTTLKKTIAGLLAARSGAITFVDIVGRSVPAEGRQALRL